MDDPLLREISNRIYRNESIGDCLIQLAGSDPAGKLVFEADDNSRDLLIVRLEKGVTSTEIAIDFRDVITAVYD